MRLIKHHLQPPGHQKVDDVTEPLVFDLPQKLDALLFKLAHGAVDVLTVKRDIVGDLTLGGMKSEIGFRHIEDQPAIADVGAWKAQNVAHESAGFGGFGRIKHRVKSFDHGALL